MEETSVIITTFVIDELDSLVIKLYNKNYFSYEETSQAYVDSLFDGVKNDLPFQKHYTTPSNLARRGKYYAKIKGSKRTVWYVFFDKKDNRYFIEHISNNHTASASFLNGLK